MINSHIPDLTIAPSTRDKVIAAGVWAIGVSYVLFAVNFLCNLLIARFLGPEVYGVYVFAASIQLVVGLFCSTQINWLFIRTGGSQEEFDSVWVLALAIGIVNLTIGIGGGLLIGFVSGYVSGSIFFFLSALQLPLAMSAVYLAVFERGLDFKKIEGMRGGAGTVGAMTAVLAAWAGAGVWSLVARELIPAIVLWFLVIRVTNIRFSGSWNLSTCTLLLRESVKYSIVRILEQGFFRAPFILIGRLFGTASLGLFNQAFYVALLPNTLLSPISERIAFPAYALANGNLRKIAKGLFWANYMIIRVTVFFGIAAFLYGDRLILFLYGPEWRNAGAVLTALGLFVAVNPIFATAKTACFGIGQANWANQAYLFAIVVLLVSIYVAAQEGSMALLAVGYGVAMLVGLTYMFIRLHTHGVKLQLFDVGMAPAVYCVLVLVLNFFAKQSTVYYHHELLFAGGLILLYSVVLLAFDGKKLIRSARMLR